MNDTEPRPLDARGRPRPRPAQAGPVAAPRRHRAGDRRHRPARRRRTADGRLGRDDRRRRVRRAPAASRRGAPSASPTSTATPASTSSCTGRDHPPSGSTSADTVKVQWQAYLGSRRPAPVGHGPGADDGRGRHSGRPRRPVRPPQPPPPTRPATATAARPGPRPTPATCWPLGRRQARARPAGPPARHQPVHARCAWPTTARCTSSTAVRPGPTSSCGPRWT